MSYLLLSHQVPQRVLELGLLNEEIVLRLESRSGHRRLVIEAEPLLNPLHPGAVREVGEQGQVEHDRRRQDRIAAEKIDLDLHRIVHPPDDVDVVPPLLVVPSRRIVVDPHDVREVLVQVGIAVGLEDRMQHGELGLFLRLERRGIVEHFAVAIPADVRGVSGLEAEHARLDARSDDGLEPGLARLEVLSRDRDALRVGELDQRGNIHAEIRRPVAERDAFHERGPGVQHGRRDLVVVALHRLLERGDCRVLRSRLEVDLRRGAPDDDQPVERVGRLEVADVLAQRLGKRALVLPLLHVGAVDARDVMVVEHGGHRRDALQEAGDGREVALVEHARLPCRGERVVGDRIPRAEDNVVERRERDEIPDEWRAVVGALAEPDCRHLRQRADRLAAPEADALDAGYERRRDRAEPRREDAEPAVRRPDSVPWCFGGHGRGEGAYTAARAPSGAAASVERSTGSVRRAPGRVVASCTNAMRCTAVIHDVTASKVTIAASTSPWNARPKMAWGAESSTTRSGRWRIPTLASMPSASARARVYDVRNVPMIAMRQMTTIVTLWRGVSVA